MFDTDVIHRGAVKAAVTPDYDQMWSSVVESTLQRRFEGLVLS